MPRLVLISLAILIVSGCGSTPRTEEERAVEVTRLQRVSVLLGACAALAFLEGAADEADAPTKAEKGAAYAAAGGCLLAGVVGIFGLPSFAEPAPPAPASISQMGSARDPPLEPDAGVVHSSPGGDAGHGGTPP